MLSAAALKIIACTAMLLDHLGYALGITVPYRIIGRLAFPIYCFLIAEGFQHTRSVFRYLARLLLFAAVSEIPFNLFVRGSFFYTGAQNVFFTLFLSLLNLAVIERLRKFGGRGKNTFPRILSVTGCVLSCLICCLLAEWIRCDYGWVGVLMVSAFYLLRRNKGMLAAAVCILSCSSLLEDWFLNTVSGTWSLLQLFRIAALLPIFLYSGKKGLSGRSPFLQKAVQYGFYIFYPLHLLLISGLV